MSLTPSNDDSDSTVGDDGNGGSGDSSSGNGGSQSSGGSTVGGGLGSTTGGGTSGDGGNGGAAGLGVVCFASGTLIRTPRGDVSVQALSVGELVVTSSGEERPIRWLGHRTVDCRRHPDPIAVLPVRIAAHAFGPNTPTRDLYVSPGHSICLDLLGQVLIPAAALVNDATIAQVEVDEVTYWHVELDSHDILLAENLPAESYLDMGNRTFFKERDVVALNAVPDVQLTHADFCRPYHDGGPLIEVVRARLQARAQDLGWRLSTALDVHLEVDGHRIEPVVCDRTMRFLVPAEADDVWLVSPTARPRNSAIGSNDERALGLDLTALHIDDGFGPARKIAIDDPLLDVGFSHVENGPHRWTTGRAQLPSELWSGCTDAFFLCLDLGGKPVARWMAPNNTKELRRAV